MTVPKYKMQVTGRGRALLWNAESCKLLASISRFNRSDWMAKCSRTGKMYAGRTRYDAIADFQTRPRELASGMVRRGTG